MIGDVERNLQALRPEQYVLAFVFLCSYALALGRMLERRGRTACAGLSFAAAVGFVASSLAWEAGVALIAFALVGMGAFSGAAWLFWTLATWRAPRLAATVPALAEVHEAPAAPVAAIAAGRLETAARTG